LLLMATQERTASLRRGLRLEYLSVAWNVGEAVVAIAAGAVAGSVALVGFGLDSVVEASSASILVWRLASERRGRHADTLERPAIRAVAIAFWALAAYVATRATFDLVTASRPKESLAGIILASVSLVGMPLLARAKRRASKQLGSHAMHADAKQTILCTYLSAALLAGLVLNAAFGWWWADPVSALVIAVLAAREGYQLWVTEDPDCC
jgi:divalent metal cation (Fe/Co/Zn/Cd) transporter